ncbi:MAG: hypothetical protein ABJN65_00950 [Parasphingorhabdus sp.]
MKSQTLSKKWFVLLSLLPSILFLCGHQLSAQVLPNVNPNISELGVDLKSGELVVQGDELGVGPASARLSVKTFLSSKFRDYDGPFGPGTSHSFNIRLFAENNNSGDPTKWIFAEGFTGRDFPIVNASWPRDDPTWTSNPRRDGDFTILRQNDYFAELWHVDRYGTEKGYVPVALGCEQIGLGCGRLLGIIRQDGGNIVPNYSTDSKKYLKSVIDSNYNALFFSYDSLDRITLIKAGNIHGLSCNMQSQTCPSMTGNQYSISYGTNYFRVNRSDGSWRKYNRNSAGYLISINTNKSPLTPFLEYQYTGERVTQINRLGSFYRGYQYQSDRTIVTDASLKTTTHYFGSSKKPLWVEDKLGRRTTFEYDGFMRVTKIIDPELDRVEIAYDARGNVTNRKRFSKPTPNLPSIETSSGYNATCTNPKTCNRPNYTQDDIGTRTTFSWHGPSGMLQEKIAGVNSSGTCLAGSSCPKQTHSYIALQGAKLSNGTSTSLYVRNSSTEQISSAQNISTSFSYAADRGFALKSKVEGSGSSALRTCYTYDRDGNLIGVTNPEANLSTCP